MHQRRMASASLPALLVTLSPTAAQAATGINPRRLGKLGLGRRPHSRRSPASQARGGCAGAEAHLRPRRPWAGSGARSSPRVSAAHAWRFRSPTSVTFTKPRRSTYLRQLGESLSVCWLPADSAWSEGCHPGSDTWAPPRTGLLGGGASSSSRPWRARTPPTTTAEERQGGLHPRLHNCTVLTRAGCWRSPLAGELLRPVAGRVRRDCRLPTLLKEGEDTDGNRRSSSLPCRRVGESGLADRRGVPE
jgi:hypothetical protein